LRWAPLPVGAFLFLGAVGLVLAFAFLRPGPVIVIGVIVLLFAPGRWWRWRLRRFRRGVRAIQRGDLTAGRAELETFLDGIGDPERFERIQPLFNLGKRYSYRAAALSNLGVAALTAEPGGAAALDLQTAGARFEEALTVDPDYVQAHYGLAMVSRLTGDTTGAETEAERALALNPGYLPARLLLATVRRERGDIAGADQALEPLSRHGKDPENLMDAFRQRWPS
jgi:tetratricopeptide (TPR) repeat protein